MTVISPNPRHSHQASIPGMRRSDDLVDSLVGNFERLLNTIVKGLADRCAAAGRVQADALNREQSACYELAFASAEILAARQFFAASVEIKTGRHDAGLVAIYVADVLLGTLDRLERIARHLGVALDDVADLRNAGEWRAILEHGGFAAQERLGAAIIAGDGFGDVAMSVDAHMSFDSFARFATDVVRPLAEDIHRHDLIVPEALLGPMREMGIFGLGVSARFGGTAPDDGDDNHVMIAITEALSEASLGAAGSLITRAEILARAMAAGGTEAQKARFLPGIAAGAPLCAISITEPDYGSDVASISLRATRTDGGWLLNGAKTWCTFAGKAGLLMVVARTGEKDAGHKGLSIMLVEKPSFEGHEFSYEQPGGGLLTGRAIPTIGYRGMHSFDLAFENVFVPDDHLLGGEAGLGKGFYYTMAGMTGGRMQTAARACGVMRAAIGAARSYAAERKVFGRTLGDYPLTQAKIARMAARFVACRHLTYAVGTWLDEGRGQMEASLVKLLACRSAELVTREAQQIHGGMGYAEEMAVSRYFVDARVLSIFEGAEETLALKVIAKGLLERALGDRQSQSSGDAS